MPWANKENGVFAKKGRKENGAFVLYIFLKKKL
jgi:hypothetical protein